ncbi:MAG: type I DNA topoisomerase [Candidatus Caenarcaniphilales bacterium]|nr:type I DNA topoisomerase [Candidatus Caenarcaniphilales bacterium]
MKLLIVESPGKIKKIRSFLEDGWQVTASVGHIRDLPKKELGVVFQNGRVQLQYINSAEKLHTIKSLQATAEHANEIYLAMDMDREGEAIAWHVGLVLGKENWPKIKRVAFNEITKSAVLKAISNPRRVDANLVNAQQARRAVDRLVGFKVSPLVWAAQNAGTSAGRVQSVAVRLVVEREREIRNFVVQNYWKIKANTTPELANEPQNNFWSELVTLEGKALVSSIEKGKEKKQIVLADKGQAEELLEKFKAGTWTVVAQTKEVQSKNPYAPYVTSTLQQAASVRLKWNSQKTMKVAQALYEDSLITYMRTDSPAISQEALAMVRGYVQKSFPAEYLPAKPYFYKAKGGNAQEAHECIRPTNVDQTPQNIKSLDADQLALYSLIWKQFVACQMAAARFNVATIDTENGPGLFRAVGRQIIFDGWTKLTGSAAQSTKDKDGGDADEDDEDGALLPEVKVGDNLLLNEIKSSQHKTKPPSRYTEATLIRTLEKFGIGRPSTYSSIMENIKRRGYVREEKRKFWAEAVGEVLVDLLLGTFATSWMDYGFTAEMESSLDKVAEGELDWNSLVITFNEEIENKVKATPKEALEKSGFELCDKCGKHMVKRKSQRGPFLGCSGYPDCRNIKPFNQPFDGKTQPFVLSQPTEVKVSKAKRKTNKKYKST